jgi:hypothetical protein
MKSSGQRQEEGHVYNDGSDPGNQGKRSWFGPKRFGYGYRPQTWQGFLISGLLIAFIIVLAAVTGGHSKWMMLAIIPAAGLAIFARTMGSRR